MLLLIELILFALLIFVYPKLVVKKFNWIQDSVSPQDSASPQDSVSPVDTDLVFKTEPNNFRMNEQKFGGALQLMRNKTKNLRENLGKMGNSKLFDKYKTRFSEKGKIVKGALTESINEVKRHKKMLLVLLALIVVIKLVFSIIEMKKKCPNDSFILIIKNALGQSLVTMLFGLLGLLLVCFPFVGKKIFQQPFITKDPDNYKVAVATSICFMIVLCSLIWVGVSYFKNKTKSCTQSVEITTEEGVIREWNSAKSQYLDKLNLDLNSMPSKALSPVTVKSQIDMLKSL